MFPRMRMGTIGSVLSRCVPLVALLLTENFTVSCMSCTAIGCDDGFSLQIVNPDGTPVQNFTVSMTIEGVLQSASCPMVTSGMDAGMMSADADSADAQDAGTDNWLSRSCSSDGTIFFSGADYPTVMVVQITVHDDPPTTWEESIFLAYQDVYANGEDCGVTCTQAHAKVTRKF